MTATKRVGIWAAAIAFAARIVSILGLAASANAAQAEGEVCPCCEAQATPASIGRVPELSGQYARGRRAAAPMHRCHRRLT